MTEWVEDLESTIFTIIKSNFPQRLKNKYPKIEFTNKEQTDKKANFPTVLVTVLPMVERGQDLKGDSINAVLLTVQIDVSTNTTKKEAQEIAYAVISILKTKYFNVIALPNATIDGDICRSVSRARRIIGSGDTI